tara:strand:+ start:31 stop:216 length:186 start_codon:yes stop_codon:yes gene_type:complete
MDKKDFENLSVGELKTFKESINDKIENKRVRQTFSNANRKGLALVWVAIGIAITLFRLFAS